jgi:hypothetical protein
MKRVKLILCGGLCMAMAACGVGDCPAGELTVEGNLTVKTNLTVQGQLSSASLVLTNLVLSGQATLQKAEIRELVPLGDLSMGPYTNRAAP